MEEGTTLLEGYLRLSVGTRMAGAERVGKSLGRAKAARLYIRRRNRARLITCEVIVDC